MKNSIKLVTLLLTAGFYSACTRQLPPDTQSRIPLEGNWGLQLDTAGAGIAPDWLTKSCTDSLFLPGTTDMGKKGTYNTDMTLTTFLSREYVFEGKALYTKQVDIPEEWDGTSVRLVMERTKPTTIWIDGKEVGANNDISTAQQYDLSSYLFPGTHTVAILVDNGKQAVPEKVYGSSHAYSASTQTNWNGIIGDFYLESVPLCGIDAIQLYPDVAKKVVTARVTLRNPDKGAGKGILSFYAEAWNTDKQHKTPVQTVEVDWTKPEQELELALGDKALLWSEFTPSLYRFSVSLKTDQSVDTEQATFGLRDFKTKGRQFTMNGKTTFLRGKHDACVFPLIAHTAMDVETWRHYFQVAKQYGINHYRFHSWCPPEACFEAADIEGIYLQPELPIWGNIDIDDTELCDYLLKEGRNLHRAYSNHASFVMFGLGNEMSGEEGLAMLIQTFKKEDNRHIYSSGSNNYLGFKGKQANEDYFTTCRVGREGDKQFNTHARASFSFADAYDGGYLNHTYPNSEMDFSSANVLCDVPIISHETAFQCGRRNAQPPGNRNIIFYILVHSAATEAAEGEYQQQPNFTNALNTADPDFKPNTRLNGSGGESTDVRTYTMWTSNYIGCKSGDVIRVRCPDGTFESGGGSIWPIAVQYNGMKTSTGAVTYKATSGTSYDAVFDSDGKGFSITINDLSVAFIRIVGNGDAAGAIITKNQEIAYKQVWVGTPMQFGDEVKQNMANVFVQAPNGTLYIIAVDNSGNLSAKAFTQ